MAELKTQRLLLRCWRPDDRAPFAALNANRKVMRYFPGPLTRQASDALADRIDAGIAQDGWGLWAPHELATGRFLGFTGLSRATFEAPFTPAVEVGWRLARAAWGSGFASEAAHAATACGFDVLGLDEIVSFTAEGNARSRAVMRRLGMRRALLDESRRPRRCLRAACPAETCGVVVWATHAVPVADPLPGAAALRRRGNRSAVARPRRMSRAAFRSSATNSRLLGLGRRPR
jgi:RimJ/RimL family protein N-acetyltransferase